ncbi:putative 2OG-Fe(II) oxygenase [Sphingomonas sp. NSE70-1]|uniref:2OG-Fe(II) oxygenase n=1 Tax=Sphingomonas caseinilyticus TaxID=2908205 RepID=A0ABT0RSF0_9SPHN|nr:putative 2OG-Fe(II) oxygenase [Sphingomonas caseinilyticus]MCL6697620.1 putative 2OG-Fe(II) oxygenase [Sphingomonas caseinilyticus]
MSERLEAAEWERRALAFEAEQRLDEAREAFETALRLDPSSKSLAEGRARIAIRLDEDGAAEHCARALAFHLSDPDLQIQMIATATASLGGAARPLLESFLDRQPDNVTAHELLASLRFQAGEGDRSVDRYVSALTSTPDNKRLYLSYLDTLTRAQRLTEALYLMDQQRDLFRGHREFDLVEANTANHAGLTDRAEKALDRLDNQPDAQMARGQHRLQTNRPDEASALLEEVVRIEPDNLSAWALLEVAWRLTEDSRHEWLAGQPGLFGSVDLELGGVELDAIAGMLRTVHRSRAQPIGQSVRGGTQTPGQLFVRNEPEIGLLTNALAEGIRQFHGKLPPYDPNHPLLKYRNEGLAFGPSWSVRLTGGGFHAAHFHPGGVLSSACYISLPESVAGSADREGWLEIGRPPAEMGLDLPPLSTFEPKPGRLVLFPSYLFHGTRPFSNGERLTVAFDLVPVPLNG